MSTPSPIIPYDDSPCTDQKRDVEMLRVGRWPSQSVEWLWPSRIPLGKVTLLVGDPGTGKSLIALDIAARVARAAPWPDDCSSHTPRAEAAGPENGEASQPPSSHSSSDIRHSSFPTPASVLLLSVEDDLADTIRPRLEAAGADSQRIFLLPSIADLRHDFAQLKAAVRRTPDCRLIIVDPINAFVGPNDSHFQTVLRKVLAPLARLAASSRIAVLAIAHFRKTSGAPIHRTAGSMGFVSAARSVWALCRDHADPGRSYFLPLKTNLTAAACGLAYRIQTHATGNPYIEWEPTPIATSAEIALSPPPKQRREPSNERAAARNWLREFLAAGPRPASAVFENGKERGFLPRTLQRAFYEMDGHTAKKGLLRGWWWSLNDHSAAEVHGETPNSAVAFEGVTYEQDIANQRQHEELANPKLPEFNFPPLSNIPPIAFDNAKLDALAADLVRKAQRESDKLIQLITR